MIDVVVNGTQEALPDASTPLNNQENYYPNLLSLLGFDKEHLPLADFLRQYYGLEGQWLIASPIHWEATHNDAMIVAIGQELQLSEEESLLWFAEVATFLKADGFTPIYHDAETWLINITEKPAISSQTVHTILHQSLMPLLAKLDKTLYWQRLHTELQMVLSNHPLNTEREDKLAINGLWFWGEDTFTLKNDRPIATDDERLLTLAANNTSISLLTASSVFTKNHLLLVNNKETIQRCHLEKKTQKKKVHWYWNNVAYVKPAKHWWSRTRLWSK